MRETGECVSQERDSLTGTGVIEKPRGTLTVTEKTSETWRGVTDEDRHI